MSFPIEARIFHFFHSHAHWTAITFNALSWCFTFPIPANFWHPARRCWSVSLYLLHNLNCSWSIILLIFFHLIVSTICSCRLKTAAVFLGSVFYCNHLCPLSSSSFSHSFAFLSLWGFSICFDSPIFQLLFRFLPSYLPVIPSLLTYFNRSNFEINNMVYSFYWLLYHL